MKKITPFLWFDKNLKEIVNFYSSVFPDLKILSQAFLKMKKFDIRILKDVFDGI